MAERNLIQTAAILICLTGKRGDNLPQQQHTLGGEGGKERQKRRREREKAKDGRLSRIVIRGWIERVRKRKRV